MNGEVSGDERAFSETYDILGVTVEARRAGPGEIVDSYQASQEDAPSIGALLTELRGSNENQRETRTMNVVAAPPPPGVLGAAAIGRVASLARSIVKVVGQNRCSNPFTCGLAV